LVKHLKLCVKCLKLLVLTAVLVILGVGFWLHSAEHPLGWAKPWIVATLNPKTSPFTVAVGDVSLDWRDMSALGKLRISKMTISKRDGPMFAQLPEMYVTIDPLGFLPGHHLLHRIFLHRPKLFMMRNSTGSIQLGLEDADTPEPLAALFTTVTGDQDANPSGRGALPFREFIIDNATLTFTDEASGAKLVSTPVALRLARESGRYDAALSMPFSYEDTQGKVTATLRTAKRGDEDLLNVQVANAPATLFCVFGLCPDRVEASGAVDGIVGLRLAGDGTLLGVRANVSTKQTEITAPDWFEKPLKLGPSTIAAHSDLASHTITLSSMQLQLEDTTATAHGTAHHGLEGWTVEADGEAGALDITKVYKYWPLFMAPDSRAWVTGKLKSGHAAKGTLHLDLKPEDFTAPNISDKALDAYADARDITFEYLPGFPLIEHMNGDVHFTGGTVKVDGSGGTLLKGTTISKATLWCPDLNNLHNPMEASATVSGPASDVATLLQQPILTFDDAAKLDPAKITGAVDATIGLKFNAFSGNTKDIDPNVIHLEAVDYDIAATLKDIAQLGLFGSYDAKAINGTFKATNNSLAFDGSVALGDTGVSDVKLFQPEGKPLTVSVKSRAGQTGKASNNFSLTYATGADGPNIAVSGQRLDASASYGTGDHQLLKNFPALHLRVNLEELLLASGMPFTQVAGTLDCGAARCDGAHFTAAVGPPGKQQPVRADITHSAGARQFALTANNAGSFLKALNITDRMIDGKLILRGPYDDNKNPPQLNAHLLIRDFTVQNSQILGRIFSIGSLTGLTNALTGSGIAFDKMIGDITSRAGLITVDKGRANGTAMGITVGGTVDTTTTKLNLKGVVVPAYALNSLLGKIPLIGALAGGEGEGLIAFNYSVRGTYEQPDVSVNPLSGLTPGFLRGIFGIFDQPDKPEPDHNADEPPAAPKPLQNLQPAPPALATPIPNNGRH
jgi:hypothetical protein